MGFTPRQAQILELAAQGCSDKEIARDLSLSVNTVRSHLQRLYQREGLANRAEAVAALMSERAAPSGPEPLAVTASSAAFLRRAVVVGALAGAALALTGVVLWITAAPGLMSVTAAPVATVAGAGRAPPG